jgi:hypothetical protein
MNTGTISKTESHGQKVRTGSIRPCFLTLCPVAWCNFVMLSTLKLNVEPESLENRVLLRRRKINEGSIRRNFFFQVRRKHVPKTRSEIASQRAKAADSAGVSRMVRENSEQANSGWEESQKK